MKQSTILTVLVLTILAYTVACSKYLDIVPDETPSEKDAFKDVYAAERFLYSCYASLPDPRDGSGSLDLMTADEVVTAFEHETFAKFPKGEFTSSTPVITYWPTLYKGIRQCYLLIDRVDQTPELSNELKSLYKAEAKFLIGYYSFLLVRMYGPIIIHKKLADFEIPASEYPTRSTYDECVRFVCDMLDEAAGELPPKRMSTTDYGRASSIAAKGIKARMLLYAASPLFNGGGGLLTSFYSDFKRKSDGEQLISTTYDKEKWKKAADAALEAINLATANGYELYHYNNAGVNSQLPANATEKDLRFTFVDKNSNEVIFADTRREGLYGLQNKSTPFISTIAYNGIGPTLTMVESFYTERGLPIDKDPAFDYTGRYKIVAGPLGNTLKLNLKREPRFNAWISYHNSNYEIIRGTNKFVKMNFRKSDPHGIQNRSNNYSPTGYLNKKGVHPLTVQTQLSVTQHYPWPLLRLAELYLDYAEALIEYGSDLPTAKEYIDKVRTRAGIPTIDVAWNSIGGASDQATLRSIIRQERTIELYLENHRFWDVRRWVEAEKYLGVQAKGMNINGGTDADFFKVTTVVFPRNFRSPAFYLLPIPINELNKSNNLDQNIGY